MIGIVLVTHGNLAIELVAALEHVVGPQAAVRCVCIGAEDDMEKRRMDILHEVQAVGGRKDAAGAGAVVLTDMFGGTPSNLAISIMEKAKVEVVAGVNLPMLIKLASVRDDLPLLDAANACADAGRKYISVASALLEG
jgi:mannose PTS system EIIA component